MEKTIETPGTFIDAVIAIFRRKKKKSDLDDRHDMVLSDLGDIVSFDDTEINVDQLGRKYYVDNKALHVTYCIVGNSNVIIMVNSHDNVEKKFDSQIIDQAIKIILEEKNRRMEKTFLMMEQRADLMIDRIGSTVRKEKELRLSKK